MVRPIKGEVHNPPLCHFVYVEVGRCQTLAEELTLALRFHGVGSRSGLFSTVGFAATVRP